MSPPALLPHTLPTFSLRDRLLPDWPGPDIVQRNVRIPVCADKGASEEGATGGSQGQEMSVWDAYVAPLAVPAAEAAAEDTQQSGQLSSKSPSHKHH